jgi:hypothetical protein
MPAEASRCGGYFSADETYSTESVPNFVSGSIHWSVVPSPRFRVEYTRGSIVIILTPIRFSNGFHHTIASEDSVAWYATEP